ncbi:MAG TPA: dihydrolipoamide acetyltransferase family protein [Ktedonobacterales bacterium]
MATNVILPALGMAQDTGKIVEWLKAEGQHVTAGEPLVTIETDKAAVDIEAPASGILARVSAKPGDEVPVAQVIAVILSPEEAEAGAGQPKRMPAQAIIPASESVPAQAPQPAASAEALASVSSPYHSGNGRHRASPKARRIAAERGVDLAAVRGTGPGGSVLAADVLAVDIEATTLAVTPPPEYTSPAIGSAPLTADQSAVSTIWRLMAERTTKSWTTIPHFFLARDVAAERLVAWRARAVEQGFGKVTYTDLLVKLVAVALRRHTRLNASWQGGTIIPHNEVNIGLAVAVEDGLVVPVIHRADTLHLGEIATRRADLVGRAQAGRLRPDDLQHGTFTISNLGMYGIDAFNAIINEPQAAILAVGRMVDRVVPVNGQPAVRPMMTLTMSCDHRVVDGARGAEFLATVAALIEEPLALLE